MNKVNYTHPQKNGGLRECMQCGYFTNVRRGDCAICGSSLALINLSDKPMVEHRLSVAYL